MDEGTAEFCCLLTPELSRAVRMAGHPLPARRPGKRPGLRRMQASRNRKGREEMISMDKKYHYGNGEDTWH